MGSGSRYNNIRARKRKGFVVKSTTTPTNEDGSSAKFCIGKKNFIGYSSLRCSCNCC